MKIILAFVCSLISFSAFSQLGVNVRYQNLDSELWKKWTNEENLFSNNYEIGLDYWFRLKEYRVEFMPEIYYNRSSTVSTNTSTFRTIGLAVNTNFYLFDFIGDCDCPTFSKDGNRFTKGFYLSVAPLFEQQMKSHTPLVESFTSYEYGVAIGAGLDIGITDLITVSPFIRYKYLPGVNWDTLALERAAAGEEVTTTNLGFLQFGLRLGFRPDYVREQNKYRFR